MERSVIAENECETDRRLCAEAADGLGSSRARRRNTAFVLPAVCLPACVFLSVCVSAYLSVCLSVGLFGKCFEAHQYAFVRLHPNLVLYLLIVSSFSPPFSPLSHLPFTLSYFDLQTTFCRFFPLFHFLFSPCRLFLH